jgi:hypothetical protein
MSGLSKFAFIAAMIFVLNAFNPAAAKNGGA